MVIVKLIGGLGNQMFQYALGRHLSKVTGSRLVLDVTGLKDRSHDNFVFRDYELEVFFISSRIASEKEIAPFFFHPHTYWQRLVFKVRKMFFHDEVVREKGMDFDTAILNKTGNIYLDGYWQSEKYFKAIEKIIREDFSFSVPPSEKNLPIIQRISTTNAVSIHIRRGDYVNRPETNQFHGTCSLDYYQKAIEIIREKVPEPTFFVFSDEPEWVENNFFPDLGYTIVSHNTGPKSFEDMRLMSLCQHNIIANSSFSWWGAWLNQHPDKIVIAPSRWFNDPANVTPDLLPTQWIKI